VSAPTDPLVTTEAHAGASPVVPVVLASIDANVLVVANWKFLKINLFLAFSVAFAS
jgi:hypothetical protein